jgi:hypothetical protein
MEEKTENARQRRVTVKNVEVAFELLAGQFPPVLTLDEAAEIARLQPSTLKRHVSEGQFKTCTIRGKPLRFWRNKFVVELFAK